MFGGGSSKFGPPSEQPSFLPGGENFDFYDEEHLSK
jgi:hypothetical protein